MEQLVFINNNDVFTNSLIIAENLNYEHRVIVKHFKTYKERFGTLSTQSAKSIGGRPMHIYLLNEPQAIF